MISRYIIKYIDLDSVFSATLYGIQIVNSSLYIFPSPTVTGSNALNSVQWPATRLTNRLTD